MRLTKKLLREAKHSLFYRIREICKIASENKIDEEFQRCFPYMEDRQIERMTNHDDWQKLYSLLTDAVEGAIPQHWHD